MWVSGDDRKLQNVHSKMHSVYFVQNGILLINAAGTLSLYKPIAMSGRGQCLLTQQEEKTSLCCLPKCWQERRTSIRKPRSPACKNRISLPHTYISFPNGRRQKVMKHSAHSNCRKLGTKEEWVNLKLLKRPWIWALGGISSWDKMEEGSYCHTAC